ncbi:MAG TPA: TetR/AcrR family transcriptional regulator [Ilumatobacter sp.]|nr:TetR/AcrR family transcriptional regulator [Ilumatobacter sp.]
MTDVTMPAPAAPAPAAPAPDSHSGRERILDVAAAAFLAHGYEAASLRHIAEAAGMKAGSLYYHFASKDDLLTEILRRGIAVMNVAFDEADAIQAGSPADRVAAHVRAHLAALYENGPYTAAHITTFRTAPAAVRDEIVKLRDAYEARWTTVLKSLQRDGALSADVNINLARLALFAVMNSSVEWFDQTRGNLDDFAAIITRQFWTGVAV